MRLFFSQNINQNEILLKEEEFNHCKNVLRLKIEETVHVIDGKGNLFLAKIKNFTKQEALLEIIEQKSHKKDNNKHCHIAIALTKNIDRIEWLVEKATEMGIDEFSFLYTQRTERKNLNLERIQKIAISAIKQSKNYYLPILNPLIGFMDFMEANKTQNSLKIFPHLIEDQERNSIQNIFQKSENQDITALIGPEGDFTIEELAIAIKYNYIPVSLGNTVLRTETAGIYVASLMRYVR